MTMAQLNRTMPELPSRLDKSKLPKIPGLNLSGITFLNLQKFYFKLNKYIF